MTGLGRREQKNAGVPVDASVAGNFVADMPRFSNAQHNQVTAAVEDALAGIDQGVIKAGWPAQVMAFASVFRTSAAALSSRSGLIVTGLIVLTFPHLPFNSRLSGQALMDDVALVDQEGQQHHRGDRSGNQTWAAPTPDTQEQEDGQHETSR